MIDLLPKQSQAITKQLTNKVGALFMKMGTGKTRVAVELVNAVSDLDLVVYIAPLDIIRPKDEKIQPISNEVEKWGGFNAKEVVYMGIETIGMSDRSYLQLYKKISTAWKCFLIIDESIKVKNIDAKRTLRVIEYSKMVEYKLILNGEPITRDLLDLWSQFYILDPRILNMSLAEFKNTFCKYTTVTKSFPGTYKSYTKTFITGYENIDYLYSLIGEYVYECDLPEFEPETFNWLCKRVKGIDTAMRYGKEKQMYSNEKLPSHYKTWKDFRDFLLKNHPNKKQKERFEKRFANHPEREDVFKQQVGQLLINDWENITDVKTDQEQKRKEVKQKWIDIL